MSNLNSIVDIQIDKITQFPTRVGFGEPLIVDENAGIGDTAINTITSLDEMVQNGYAVTDEAYLMVQAIFSQSPRPPKVTVANKTDAETLVEAVTRIRALYDDWYFLLSTERDEAEVLATAAYIEALPKLFFTATDDADSANLAAGGDVTSTAYQLSNAGYDRTVLLFASSAPIDQLGAYPDGAWVGKIAPKDPGSVTWKFKTLNGIPANPFLTSTQITNLEAKNTNVYVQVAGVNITQQGVTVSGEFIDIIRGTDKLQRRIQESVYTVLSQEDKVPYTNAGGDAIGAAVQAPIDEAITDGLLAGGDERPVVQVPAVLDIPQAQRALREFGDITFEGRYAGAIHKVTIRGRITV